MVKDKRQLKILIYALCNVYYDSYYIKGLEEYFGKKVEFSLDGFPQFAEGSFAFRILDGKKEIKLAIDSRDTDTIFEDQLEWCDVYGKVNYQKSNIPVEYFSKVKAIGPSFGIQIWNLFQTCFFAFKNFIKSKSLLKNKREFIANYWRQYNRFSIEKYANGISSNDYVFFMGTIWKNEKETNLYRSFFIRVCKNLKNLTFEGGFAPRKDLNNLGYDDLVTLKRYPFKYYLQKSKKSALVFNTPAVLSCHGWKLAEFLAMGKAIISTDHINQLPSPLIDGIHIKYVQIETNDFEDKIKNILQYEDKRKFLEQNARAYFDNFLTPKKVIESLYLSVV